MEKYIDLFQVFVNEKFYQGNPEDVLISCIKVLSLLYHSNEYTSKPIVDISKFYNDSISKKLNFKEEYKQWKSKSTNIQKFSFLNFPFLFNPASKTRILHISSMVSMSLEFEDAFVHQALVIHAQRFLDDKGALEFEKDLENSGKSNPYLVFSVRRETLIDDVFEQIKRFRNDLKKPLKVRFVQGGEHGLDQGGVQKEFFQILFASLMDPVYGMFEYDEETRFTWFNRACLEGDSMFEYVGILLGLALYNGVMVGISFPCCFYKKLLSEEIHLDDFKASFPVF